MTIAAPPRLEIDGLRKRYGAHQALAGLSLRVDAGEIVGLLGPNGAGKTTTIESVAGLIQPDEGHMLLDGAPLAVARRARIGIALQNMALQDKATPAEALRLFASLYDARPNIDALLERFGLSVLANQSYATLSGGQKQRLALALAFLNDPALILLDEPTAGLDLDARHGLHQLIRALAADGRSILLATHDMAEAEQLCDRVVIIDRGLVIAQGRPADLIGSSGATISGRTDRPLDPALCPRMEGLSITDSHFHCRTQHAHETMAALLACAEKQCVRIESLHMREATLEEVILSLTGKGGGA